MQDNHIRILEELTSRLRTVKENIILDAKGEAEDQITGIIDDLEHLLFEVKGE